MSNIDENNLPVMEIFSSIQGEGHYSGQAAIFLRLAGCDVGCHWCDVKESWDANEHEVLSLNEISARIKELGAKTKIIVVTGGEPVMYQLGKLTSKLTSLGYLLHLETSGAYELTGEWHWICLSPKKRAIPMESFYGRANELKVVIYNKDDLNWAITESEKVGDDCRLYLQPEWSKFEEIKELLVEFAKSNTRWILSLQQHKYLNIR